MGAKFRHGGRVIYEMDHAGIGAMLKGPEAQAAVLAAAEGIAAKDEGYVAHSLDPKNRATASVVAVGWWGQTRQAHLKLQQDAGAPPSAPNTWPDQKYMGRRKPEFEWGEPA